MVKRKLTTVFCADVQNYGRMMARDEAATLARLNRYRGIMEKLFEKREGRKVNTWGDAVIAEFGSVVEAVRCAVEIQEAINAENEALAEEERMRFRIGINLGDVMVDDGDIYGDGVNVAARLESLAEPGGILVSQSVYNFTHKQLAIGYDFAGEQPGKDDEQPIPTYRVRLGGENRPREEEAADAEPAPHHAARAAADAGATGGNDRISQLVRVLANFGDWLAGQNRRVRFAVAMIGFFFAINLLFTGLATPWFIFPSLPFALIILNSWRKEPRGK